MKIINLVKMSHPSAPIQDKNRGRRSVPLGNIPLFILFAIMLSFSVFAQLNHPHGGALTGPDLDAWGSSWKNPIGFVTSHFVHSGPEHLLLNVVMAVFLFLFAVLVESKKPSLRTTNPFLWLLLPVILAGIVQVSLLNPKSSVGMSILDSYILGFLLVQGGDVLLRYFLAIPLRISKLFFKKERQMPTTRDVLLGVLVCALVGIILSALQGYVSIFSPATQPDLWRSEFSHLIGFMFGVAVGFYFRVLPILLGRRPPPANRNLARSDYIRPDVAN